MKQSILFAALGLAALGAGAQEIGLVISSTPVIQQVAVPRTHCNPACATETTYENRTVSYDVTYEYAGRRFTTQMPYDPGPTLQLQVTPYAATQQPAQASAPVTAPPVMAPPVQQQEAVIVHPAQPAVVYQPQPIVVQSYPTYPAYPAYPAYAPYPYYRPYFPVGISLGYVYRGGGGHHHHGGGHRRR